MDKAVFVAAGAHNGMKVGIPGEDLKGVYDAIEFLRDMNLGKDVVVGKRVAVIGGGNSAIDSARTALRKGAELVELYYRRGKQDMPALLEEITAAEEEGVVFHFLMTPTEVLGYEGKVCGLKLIRMELKEYDSSGRGVPYPVEGSESEIIVDTVIEAIGQRPDTSYIKQDECEIGRGGTIIADKRTLVTQKRNVFAGGDVIGGPQTVVEAIAAGQRAASSIRRYLQGKELLPLVERKQAYKPIEISTTPPTDEEVRAKARISAAEISIHSRKKSFREVKLTYTPEEAIEEASRCLRCDLEGEE
jgi:NADPH-dependent glutamate synthase beta subunit-like oxidoreductase